MQQALTITDNLPALAREINEAHCEVRLAVQSMLMEARRAGEALLAAKQALPRGGFDEWVSTETRASRAQAYLYIKVAKRFREGPSVETDDLTGVSLEQFVGYRSKPTKPASSFTPDGAEYALKLHALAERGVGGEMDTAVEKLEGFAKQHGMTSGELVQKAKGLRPAQNLTPVEAEKNQLRTEILAPFQALSKTELLDVIFDLFIRLSKGETK